MGIVSSGEQPKPKLIAQTRKILSERAAFDQAGRRGIEWVAGK